jgi:hypothetical protein
MLHDVVIVPDLVYEESYWTPVEGHPECPELETIFDEPTHVSASSGICVADHVVAVVVAVAVLVLPVQGTVASEPTIISAVAEIIVTLARDPESFDVTNQSYWFVTSPAGSDRSDPDVVGFVTNRADVVTHVYLRIRLFRVEPVCRSSLT